MKQLVLILAAATFVGCAASSPVAEPTWPTSVEQAVVVLRHDMSEETVEWVRRNSVDDVAASLHLPFGTGVRNAFGLWGRNRRLLASCGTPDAEECSDKIFRSLWASVRAETDPELGAALDCQFSLVERVTIDTRGFHSMRIGEVLQSVQRQMEKQVAPAGRECQQTVRLVPENEVDLSCWTRYEFEDPATLHQFLNWFSWRNGAEVFHYPPEVRLRFGERCAWPEPPTWFNPSRRDA